MVFLWLNCSIFSVNTLHCVVLSVRMGRHFISPHLMSLGKDVILYHVMDNFCN